MNSVPDFAPIGRLAEVASVAENVFGFFTLTIFAGTLLNQKNVGQTKAIGDAISSIKANANSLDQFVRSEFRITTMEEAIGELERLKAGLLGVILWLTRSMK